MAGFNFGKGQSATYGGPLIERIRKKQIQLSSGSRPDDEVIFFRYKTTHNELFRFSPTPLRVTYIADYKNPDYDAAGATDEIKAERHYLTSSDVSKETNPLCYIDSSSVASVFFKTAEIIVDNQDITPTKDLGNLRGFYSAAEKSFMTDDERIKYFNMSNCIADEKTRTDLTSPELKRALETMNFSGKLNGIQKTICFGLPSVPFLSYPRNFNLCKIRGTDPPLTFPCIPPGTEIIIKLHRTLPTHRNVEYVVTEKSGNVVKAKEGCDAEFFSHQTATAPGALFKPKVTIRDIHLTGESIWLHPKIAARHLPTLLKSPLNYFMDFAIPSIQSIHAGTSSTNIAFPLEKDTKLVYVFFTFQNLLYHNPSSLHNCSYRVVVPDTLKKITFHIGNEELFWEGGITGISKGMVNGSNGVVNFFEYLRENDWIDTTYPTYFPPDDKYTYRGFFPLNLSHLDIDGSQELSVSMQFTAANSPAHLHAVAIKVSEINLQRLVQMKKSRWIMDRAALK